METNQSHINQLINRCKKNDRKAQMEVYRLYYKAMYNSAYRIVNNEFQAEDIMQEGFLAAFTKLNTFKGEVTFGSWLKRIIINKSLTVLKKSKKLERVSLEVVPEVAEEETVSNYEELDIQFALKMINKLKDNYRIILTLNLIEGFDYEEIETILGYTNENVRTTISRAKKKLKSLVTKKQYLYHN